ncbi:hypothetical protein ACUVNF_28760, partial [Pseudomonas sp. RSP]
KTCRSMPAALLSGHDESGTRRLACFDYLLSTDAYSSEVCNMLTSAAGDIGFKLHKILNGSIIVLALLTVLEGAALTEWSAMATIFMTLGANAVAEAFSRGLADEIASKRRVTFSKATDLLRSWGYAEIRQKLGHSFCKILN